MPVVAPHLHWIERLFATVVSCVTAAWVTPVNGTVLSAAVPGRIALAVWVTVPRTLDTHVPPEPLVTQIRSASTSKSNAADAERAVDAMTGAVPTSVPARATENASVS